MLLRKKMMIDGIVYYVNPTCGSFGFQTFVSGKEKIRVHLKFQYKLGRFQVRNRKVCWPEVRDRKKGLGKSIYLKLKAPRLKVPRPMQLIPKTSGK